MHTFSTQTKLNEHVESFHVKNSGNKLHKCEHCFANFGKKTHLKRHILFNCSKGDRHKLCCVLCNKNFITEHLWKEHMQEIHEKSSEEIEKLYPKNFCKFCFKKVKNLQEHVETVHKGIRNFECHICKGKFTTKQSKS